MANIMTIRVPEDLQKILKDIAQKRGMSRNSLVLQILWQWEQKNNVE
ncbi:ribbon-helix-helix protein, CopG family [Tyzzerella sp. An114]|nr:ribbon-helix-helix protein, CopG family [Tyzzerella sp. An114]